jgi:hypothetical protein
MKSHNYNNPTGTDSEGPYWLNPETGEKLRWNGPMVGESKTYQSTIQTAMQELIDELIKESKSIDDNTALVYASICAKINFKYLEKEKQQIIEDFYAGRDDWERKYPDATNYYNQTYNQNK